MGMAQSNTEPERSASATSPNAASGSPSVEELVAFERTLADLSARMANVPADRVEPEIQLAQVILRQFLGFDRSTFAEFQDDSSLVVVSSTAVDGVDATPLGPLPPQLEWFIAKLRTGETLVIQDPADDLPPEAVGEAEYCDMVAVLARGRSGPGARPAQRVERVRARVAPDVDPRPGAELQGDPSR